MQSGGPLDHPGAPPPPLAPALAREALTYAVVGLVCFNVILGPIAIAKALAAERALRDRPDPRAARQARVAFALGVVDLVVFAVGVAVRLLL